MFRVKRIIAITAISSPFLYYGKDYFNGGVCNLNNNMNGKVVFITGANTGIGRETALQLAKQGATVVIACRDLQKGQRVVDEIKNNVHLIELDLNDLESVRKCQQKFEALKLNKIDILINNAGISSPQRYEVTKQGYESQFGINYLGHFLLTDLLIPYLKKSESGRVINVSSVLHYLSKLDLQDLNGTKYSQSLLWPYYSRVCYSDSKFLNVLHAQEIQNKYGIEACSLHPGIARTEITRYLEENIIIKGLLTIFYPFTYYFTKDARQGAQTTLSCAQTAIKNGGYYSDCALQEPKESTQEMRNRLWEISQELIKVKA